jgi:tetratricopeptide (TPR) repeat protein
MPVEIYLGRFFQHGHERRAFGCFVKDLVSRYGEVENLFYVIAEVDADSASMDLLLISQRSIIIADFKELTAAEQSDAKHIHLFGKQNGQWEYLIPGSAVAKPLGGGAARDKNPYKQMERIRYAFTDWLVEHSKAIYGERWERKQALARIKAWVVFSPGCDGNTDHLDLPWEDIRDNYHWFRVISLEQLAWEFNCTSNLHFEMTERQMGALVEQLGATRLKHLGQVLPEYFPEDLPPPPLSFLFTRPPIARELVGRDQQITKLLADIDDPTASIVTVNGFGGVGKTMLVSAVVPTMQTKGYTLRWVECKEKDLTLETLLAAIASEIKEPIKAKLILDKDQINLVDRLDIALDFLEAERWVLIFEDFHKVSMPTELEPLLNRVVLRSDKVKILLISRDHPSCLETPAWPPGAVREITLEGLSQESIPTFFEALGVSNLDEKQIEIIYQRTNGNPYAMSLLNILLQKYGWGTSITELPLYNKDQKQWFSSLLDTISKEAQELAFRLSAIRSDLTHNLINFLTHDPLKAVSLTQELLDGFILQTDDQPDVFRMHEFLRAYLYANLTEDKKKKVHSDAGRYFIRAADQSDNIYFIEDALFEAIYHFDLAQSYSEIQKIASKDYELLRLHGDWNHSHTVANHALKAARALKSSLEIVKWLTRVAEWEIDHDQLKDASLHLQQAQDQLSQIGKTKPDQLKGMKEAETQILLERGRISYCVSDFEQAANYLTQALNAAKEAENSVLRAECLMRIGRVERQQGHFDEANLHYEEVRQMSLATENKPLLIEAISHLGLIARQQDDFDQARSYFEQASATAREIGDWRGVDINSSLLADLERRAGNYDLAVTIFRECLKLSKQIGSGVGIRINQGQLAESLIFIGNFNEAAELLEDVERRCMLAQDSVGMAWTLRRKGLLLKQQGDIQAGNTLIQQGIDKLIEIGSEVYILDFEKDLGPDQPRLPGL